MARVRRAEMKRRSSHELSGLERHVYGIEHGAFCAIADNALLVLLTPCICAGICTRAGGYSWEIRYRHEYPLGNLPSCKNRKMGGRWKEAPLPEDGEGEPNHDQGPASVCAWVRSWFPWEMRLCACAPLIGFLAKAASLRSVIICEARSLRVAVMFAIVVK